MYAYPILLIIIQLTIKFIYVLYVVLTVWKQRRAEGEWVQPEL